MVITSSANPRIAAVTRLRKRRHRDRTGTFLIDSGREIARAHASGVEIVEIYGPPDADPGLRSFQAVRGPALEKLTYGERTDGLVAVARTPDVSLDRVHLGLAPFLLVAIDIEKPGNLGAILRTADAVGADAVILNDGGTDPWNPNVIRSSTGAVFTMTVAVATDAAIRNWLDKHSIDALTTSPSAPVSIWNATIPDGVAVVVGAEDKGLGSEWLHHRRSPVSIPMWGAVDSLNTSVAAAVVLYEVARRRQG